MPEQGGKFGAPPTPRPNFGGQMGGGPGRDFRGWNNKGGFGTGLPGMTAGPPGMFGVMPGGINPGQAFQSTQGFDANQFLQRPMDRGRLSEIAQPISPMQAPEGAGSGNTRTINLPNGGTITLPR